MNKIIRHGAALSAIIFSNCSLTLLKSHEQKSARGEHELANPDRNLVTLASGPESFVAISITSYRLAFRRRRNRCTETDRRLPV